MCKHKIFTLDDWTKKHIEPVIKNIDKIIEATHPQDCSRELVKLYWTSFAQNSANLFIMMRVSFSNGNVIAIHSFRCHPNPQMLQKYPKGSTV